MAGPEERAALTAAELLAGRLAAIAGPATRSVILHGSLSSGDFRPGRSDIDLLAVIDGGLADSRAAAVERLVRRAGTGGAAGIDLHVVTAEVAATPARAPALELRIGRYGGSSVEVERRAAASPDLPVELSVARADGRALRGAAPREVIAPVPADWIVDRGRYWLLTWRSLTGDAEHAAFMVLTACRIWRFAEEGVHCSKTQAARWALNRDPSLTAVRQAADPDERATATIGEEGIAGLLDTVLRETTRAR